MKGSAWMTPRARMQMEQDYKARSIEKEMKVAPDREIVLKAAAKIAAQSEAKWENKDYNPKRFSCLPGGEHIKHPLMSELMPLLYRYPVVGDTVQMVIENRDSPEPEIRPFKIIQVLDKRIGLVNGMLFMANSDIRAGEPGILGGGMSQAIRSAGFEVPNAVRGVFWLDRVRFHPVGLPRQQTTKVEKRIPMLNVPGETEYMGDTFETVDEPLWESPGVPLLEATWRWCQ